MTFRAFSTRRVIVATSPSRRVMICAGRLFRCCNSARNICSTSNCVCCLANMICCARCKASCALSVNRFCIAFILPFLLYTLFMSTGQWGFCARVGSACCDAAHYSRERCRPRPFPLLVLDIQLPPQLLQLGLHPPAHLLQLFVHLQHALFHIEDGF